MEGRSLAHGGGVGLARHQRDDRGRDVAAVRDRDLGQADLERLCALEGASMEREPGLAAAVPADFDVTERDSAPAEPQRLHRRFFGREAAGNVLGEGARMSPRRADLTGPEDAVEETLAVALEDGGHAIDLREVEAEEQP